MSEITVTINANRIEKINRAWRAFHSAQGLQFATYANLPDSSYFNQWATSPLPSYFWREPHTGVIMKKPQCLQTDRLTPGVFSLTFYYKPTDFTVAGTNEGANPLAYNASTTNPDPNYMAQKFQLKSVTDNFLALSVDGILAAANPSARGLVWNWQTPDLAANQGWTCICSPPGIYGDGSQEYLWLAWGGKFILSITLNGIATLGGYNGASWVSLQEFDIGGAGINTQIPFQVTCIPFGKRFMTFLFTQAGSGSTLGKNSSIPTPNFSSQEQGFLVILRGPGFEPGFDARLNQWIKYPGGPITGALAVSGYSYDLILGAVVYTTDQEQFNCSPEFPPKIPTWNTPNLIDTVAKGIDGQTESSGGIPASLTVQVRDGNNAAYVTTSGPKGKVAVASVYMNGSGSGPTSLYTPELWSLGIGYGPQLQETSYSEYDASDLWQLIRFQRTTECEGGKIELKLIDDARWREFFTNDNPIQVTATDNATIPNVVVIADGYVNRKDEGINGFNQLMVSQEPGSDTLWTRLDGTGTAGTVDAIEGSNIAETLVELIHHAGYDYSQIHVDYANCPEFYTMTFALFNNPADVLRPNENTTVGDFIRSTRKAFGVQFKPPLRVRQIEQDVYIYFGPVYTTGDPPLGFSGSVPAIFYLDDTINMATVPFAADVSTEQKRYQARRYTLQGSFEPTNVKPDFNSIEFRNAKDLSGQEGGDMGFVAADPRIFTDPTWIGYEGVERCKIMGPEDFPMSNTSASLNQQVRLFFDVNYNIKYCRTLSMSGEWQPETDVDQFCIIIGRAQSDDPDGNYFYGNPISYGVYRIEHIDVEIRHSEKLINDPFFASRRWEWTGSYKFVFVDKDTWSGIPMWTSDANLPLGAYGQ